MFDGADLSLVYGSAYDSPNMIQNTNVAPPPPPPPAVQSLNPEPPSISPASISHATVPDMPYNPPNAMYASQGPVKVAPSVPTFWDKVGNRKGDVLKLIVLSLVILLGISMDRVATHYVTNYISKAFLTEVQEFLVRVSYPVVIILVLWIIKAAS